MKILGKFSLLCLVLFIYTNTFGQSKPNIIFILADDLGYGDVGFNGQKLIKTPHIDLLAKQGMIFTQFYAGTTVCAPSRSALLTGQHTGHTYIRGNKRTLPEGQEPIADSVLTVAEVLQKAGHNTGAFGKWGLGQVGSEGDPNKQGFDQFYGYNCQSLAHRYYPNHLWENDRKVVLEANQNLLKTAVYSPDLIQAKALEFMDQQDTKKPFFLFLPYTLPHAELIVPDDEIFQYYRNKFQETPHQGDDYGRNAKETGYTSQQYPHATFAAMVARLDRYVGEVMQKLKEKGMDQNTLVIFTSDNGPHIEGGADPQFFNSGGGLRGVKRDLYEGGVREPFVARWPGTIKPNSKNDYIGAFWDIMPTFAELGKTEVGKTIDGISFTDALLGKKTQRKHDFLYWEFHEGGGKQAIRQGNWKAIRLKAADKTHSKMELYDLSKDLAEKKNIADHHPDLVKKYGQLMDQSHIESAIFPLIK